MHTLLVLVAVYSSILTILLIYNSVLAWDRELDEQYVHELNIVAVWWPAVMVGWLGSKFRKQVSKLFAIR